jgi:hypothetical protein
MARLRVLMASETGARACWNSVTERDSPFTNVDIDVMAKTPNERTCEARIFALIVAFGFLRIS